MSKELSLTKQIFEIYSTIFQIIEILHTAMLVIYIFFFLSELLLFSVCCSLKIFRNVLNLQMFILVFTEILIGIAEACASISIKRS